MNLSMTAAPARCTVPGSTCRLLQLELPGARPGWAVLDAAGERRFTGAISLHLDPEVHVWFRDGMVIYAERAGGRSIDQVLIDAGVTTAAELVRGVVELSGTRHFGRLFERVPELDRDLVEVAVELATAELLGEIADRTVPSITLSPYRYHPSGIHRWVDRPSPPAHPTHPGTHGASEHVVHDANDAVVATPATTGPVDAPVVDRTVAVESHAPVEAPTVEMLAVEALAVEMPVIDDAMPAVDLHPVTNPHPITDPHPVTDPHPAIDLRRVIEEVAEEAFRSSFPGFGDDDQVGEVPDDVRAAVRLALAEIEAATRPAMTDGITVDAFLDLDGHDHDQDRERGLPHLLGSRHA